MKQTNPAIELAGNLLLFAGSALLLDSTLKAIVNIVFDLILFVGDKML